MSAKYLQRILRKGQSEISALGRSFAFNIDRCLHSAKPEKAHKKAPDDAGAFRRENSSKYQYFATTGALKM
jgi:hypothetical protein